MSKGGCTGPPDSPAGSCICSPAPGVAMNLVGSHCGAAAGTCPVGAGPWISLGSTIGIDICVPGCAISSCMVTLVPTCLACRATGPGEGSGAGICTAGAASLRSGGMTLNWDCGVSGVIGASFVGVSSEEILGRVCRGAVRTASTIRALVS